MDLDVHTSLKQVLAKAKTFEDAKDWPKAASAYDKAANLMSLWAEQAVGRDAEERRKKKALEYRAFAQRLRSGEAAEAPSPAASPEAPLKAGAPGPAGELKSIVSNLSHVSQITWGDIGGLEDTKDEIKFALGMTLAQQPPGVRIAAWTRILFYGPPGTGKTLLAAATSNAVRSTEDVPSVFYNVKVSSILSKYFGESSKILSETRGRVLRPVSALQARHRRDHRRAGAPVEPGSHQRGSRPHPRFAHDRQRRKPMLPPNRRTAARREPAAHVPRRLRRPPRRALPRPACRPHRQDRRHRRRPRHL